MKKIFTPTGHENSDAREARRVLGDKCAVCGMLLPAVAPLFSGVLTDSAGNWTGLLCDDCA